MTFNAEDRETVVPLHSETVSIERRKLERNVRVHIRTRSHTQQVDEALDHERIEIERVPIGRQVDSIPPDRQEDDVTVVSVVEEILVVERRLFLKEEVRLRRVRTTDRHREAVQLREQYVVVERGERGAAMGPPVELSPIPQLQALREADDNK